MYQGSLAPISNREDWIVSSPLIDEDNTEVDLSTADLELFICRQGCPNTSILSGSTSDGKITTPTATSFEWRFTPEDMAALCAGTYDVFLRVTIDDVTTQILSATVAIIEGGPA